MIYPVMMYDDKKKLLTIRFLSEMTYYNINEPIFEFTAMAINDAVYGNTLTLFFMLLQICLDNFEQGFDEGYEIGYNDGEEDAWGQIGDDDSNIDFR